MNLKVTVESIDAASEAIKGVAKRTPLQFNQRLSELYNARVYFKREDLQEVRSYKIRGAYNLMSSLSQEEKQKGIVCASAGNHAQGVSFSANHLKIKAKIFMPAISPLQKIQRVRQFGGEWAEIELTGNTFDESYEAATKYCKDNEMVFVHPFNDERTMSGQGTVGKEVLEQLDDEKLDVMICPIGGGGLVSGVGTYLDTKSPHTKLIGVEPKGAPTMFEAIKHKKVITLSTIDTFVDGAAVKTVGEKTYEIASKLVDTVLLSDEGNVCTTMIDLYQNEGIVAEPAGALSISALNQLTDEIKGKTVVCILSGGNNDMMRYPEVVEKSLVYLGLKHYFLVEFAQKPGQLKKFLNRVLGPTDDIVLFEYTKKTSKERGPALIGIELQNKEDLHPLIDRMKKAGIKYTKIQANDPLYSFVL